MATAKQILQQYWHYDAFRPMQEEIINTVADKIDTLALMPTGGGKSICFQVPALLSEGVCLVVSPLVALMKDQVAQLKRRGINAAYLHAGLNYYETKQVLEDAADGDSKFLYIAPERIKSKLFEEYLDEIKFNLFAVDEAHCISQWGYDFRPSYLNIQHLRKTLPEIPIIAVTASATPIVQKDIIRLLDLQRPAVFQQSFERPNLSYRVERPSSKHHRLVELLQEETEPVIVYCRTRKNTKDIANLLRMNGMQADFYHAGLPYELRMHKQDEWINDKFNIMVSTNAFGMGIDKPNVRKVVHMDLPESIENYYQEAGRAGRDLKPSEAILFTSDADENYLHQQIELRFPDEETIKRVYFALMDFLQVPAGYGEGKLFPFDMSLFSQNFQLPILTVSNTLQALEKGGIVSFNESTWQPSTVRILLQGHELRMLDTGFDFTNHLVKQLIRMYEGIIDHPVRISENTIAEFTNHRVDEVKNALMQLKSMGVIQYEPTIDQPTVYLMLNRMYHDAFKFDYTSHLERKKRYQERIEAFLQYLRSNDICRSRYIGSYFGDDQLPECQKCDNCRSKSSQNRNFTPSFVATLLQNRLKNAKLRYADLKKEFDDITLREALYLLEHHMNITINEEGFLSKR